MLAVWRDWGLDRVLAEAYARGIVLGGSSAGSICWFAEGVTDSIAGPLTRLPCLGFVGGSNCPHYDSEKDRRPAYQAMVKSGEIQDGYAADDGVGLHFTDGAFVQAVASRPKAMGWRVVRKADDVDETAIEPVRLSP
jgi:peptidase E